MAEPVKTTSTQAEPPDTDGAEWEHSQTVALHHDDTAVTSGSFAWHVDLSEQKVVRPGDTDVVISYGRDDARSQRLRKEIATILKSW